MKYFKRGFGLQLRKFLSIALSISMVTLAMPIKTSAQWIGDFRHDPTDLQDSLDRGIEGCDKIARIVIRRPMGFMTMHLRPNNLIIMEAVGITEEGRVCKGQNLWNTCNGIQWNVKNSPLPGHEVLMEPTGVPRFNDGWHAQAMIGPGRGVAQVMATCNNLPGENFIGRLLVDPPRVMDTFGNNWASLFDQPPEDAPPPPSETAPPPPKSSGGMGAGGVLLIGAAVAAAAVGIAVAAGASSSSSSTTSSSSSSSSSCSGSYYWYNSNCTSSSCASFFGGLYASSTGPFCSSSDCTQWATTYNLVTSGCSSTASSTKRTQTPKNGCCAQKGSDF